ncbi:MAG: hypothetical protein PHZ25_00565 [Candidatus Pacebacteria bacterium]|nr:hypothetical protein [Candidatus Paceibacterota bacterium]
MAKVAPSTQDFIKIENIEEDVVILKNGGLRQIIMVSGINIDLMSEEEKNVILNSYQRFLNSLDFPVQILVHSRKFNIDNYIKNIENLEKVEQNELLKNQIFEYKEFIKTFVKENDIMNKMFLIVVPFNPISLIPAGGFLSKLNFLGNKKEAMVKEKLSLEQNKKINFRQLKQRSDQVVEGIQSIGLRAVALNSEELLELFYNFYNPETVEKQNLNIANQSSS